VYDGLAERYDWMVTDDPVRRQFFQQLFADNGVQKILDCACGTGHDLIMFNSIGCEGFASNLSKSMLAQGCTSAFAFKTVGKGFCKTLDFLMSNS